LVCTHGSASLRGHIGKKLKGEHTQQVMTPDDTATASNRFPKNVEGIFLHP